MKRRTSEIYKDSFPVSFRKLFPVTGREQHLPSAHTKYRTSITGFTCGPRPAVTSSLLTTNERLLHHYLINQINAILTVISQEMTNKITTTKYTFSVTQCYTTHLHGERKKKNLKALLQTASKWRGVGGSGGKSIGGFEVDGCMKCIWRLYYNYFWFSFGFRYKI